jgi:hypothetical protein
MKNILLAIIVIGQPLAMANNTNHPIIECKNGTSKLSVFLNQDDSLRANLNFRNVSVKNMTCEQKGKLNFHCSGSGYSLDLLKKSGSVVTLGGSVDFYGEQNGVMNIWFSCLNKDF